LTTVTKTTKQLDQARADLAAANQKLADLDAAKAEAVKTSAAFSKWRTEREGTALEIERLALLVDTFAANLEQEQADAARLALTSRKAELEKQTAALAQRITEEGAKAAAVLVQLAEEAKANAVEVEKLNRELSDDERLVHADHLARHRDPAPREDLEESVVDLWTFERTGELVSNPDDVVERAYERGFIPGIGVSRNPTPVIRKRFRQIRYLACAEREWVEPLATVLRLPRFDGPGVLFDRGHPMDPAPRQELIELIPAPDAPAKLANGEAA
jgi:hypothetical protein